MDSATAPDLRHSFAKPTDAGARFLKRDILWNLFSGDSQKVAQPRFRESPLNPVTK